MNIFKVIFAKNEVISSQVLKKKMDFPGEYKYEHEKGKLIYALIKAENEEEAISKSQIIVKEITGKIFGEDFIN